MVDIKRTDRPQKPLFVDGDTTHLTLISSVPLSIPYPYFRLTYEEPEITHALSGLLV